MRADVIVQHEHWQELPLREFLFALWTRQRRPGALPEDERRSGVTVVAYVNEGRWVAACPTPGCGGALCVSFQAQAFLCPYCWNLERGWHLVEFPAEKAAIEAELLKRPARDGWHATSRNWQPGETVARLRAENAERGIA